jgi:hypothetical protein
MGFMSVPIAGSWDDEDPQIKRREAEAEQRAAEEDRKRRWAAEREEI